MFALLGVHRNPVIAYNAFAEYQDTALTTFSRLLKLDKALLRATDHLHESGYSMSEILVVLRKSENRSSL